MATTNNPVLFLGTPEFAAQVLQGLFDASVPVLAVISMPDRPQGRGYKLLPTPVKKVAMQHNVSCYQPEKSEQLGELLKGFPPFLGLVVAYGMILPESIVRHYYLVNLHASLLPKYRGASPIQAALLNGDKETGMSLMRLDKDVDAGEVIGRETVPIHPRDQAQALTDRLIEAAIELFVKQYTSRTAPWSGSHQDHNLSTYTKKIKREDGLVDLTKESPASVYRKWQAYTPWPGIYVEHQGQRIKLIEVGLVEDQLVIMRVQVEGKSVVDYRDFLRGNNKLELNHIR